MSPANGRYKIVNFKLLAIGLLAFCSLQCRKESAITSSSAELTLSTTSLVFDTVFTTVGSTVQAFTVYNSYNQPIVISSIVLAGGSNSSYKINVDGVSGTSFSNITIPAKDSIYVFVTVSINPTNQNTPFVVTDNLNFMTNGNLQTVQLQAMGQNAIFYFPDVFPPYGSSYSNISANTTWSGNLPIVIYGYLVVDPGCTLTIMPGTRVYMHDSAVLLVDNEATININGSFKSPVTFQGDRLEPEYKNIPGQWNEIRLYALSKNNTISWAVIVNGTTGIEADTNNGTYTVPTLKMDHTIIKNMTEYGLLGEGAYITADDCEIADCQFDCVLLYIGGIYRFDQCTFADYWGTYNGYSPRTTPLLYINNYYQDAAGATISRAINSAFFGNCILYGSISNGEEIGLDSGGVQAFNYRFENCLLKTQHNTSAGYHYGDTNIINQDPLFYSPSTDDYHVNTGSPSLGNGNALIGAQFHSDLDSNSRNPPYTIGAYQQ